MNPRRVLIIRADHLGDMVLTTPLFRAMSRSGWQVDVVGPRYVLPALLGNPEVFSLHALEDIAGGFPKRWWPLAQWLQNQHYDAIIAPFAKSTGLCEAVAFSRACHRIVMWGGWKARFLGLTALRSRLLTDPRHMSDIWLDCARFLGVEPQGLQPEVFLTDEEKKWARNSRHEIFGKTPLVLVHPGCGGNTCNLPPSDYGHLLERLLKETGAGVAVTGSEKEKELTAGWPESLSQNSRFYNAMGRWSLRQFMAMIHESDLLVCVGTGPLHLASALGKRTLSPFCPLVGVSPQVWGNLGGEAHVLCGQLAHCQKEEGPRAMHCDFRGEVTVDALVASVQRLLPR